jgi:hypothetical protein
MSRMLRVLLVSVCLIPLLYAAPVSPRLASQHEQFVPYWTTEPGWHTDLQLRNNLQKSALTVEVHLRLSDGTEIVLPVVTVPANDVKLIDLRQELAAAAPQLTGSTGAYGSIVFHYTSLSTSNLYAGVMIHVDGQPIEYHLDAFHVTGAAASADYDGIWWSPQPSVNQVAVLGNYAKRQVSANVTLFSDTGAQATTFDFPLGPSQMTRIDLQEAIKKAGLKGSYGGLKIHCSDGNAVFPFHFVYDETIGFSSLMKLQRHYPGDSPSKVTLRAAMLALTNPDPGLRFLAGTTLTARVFVRNTTNQRLPVDVVANWRSPAGSGATVLSKLLLMPQQTTLLDLSAMQSSKALPPDADWAGLSLHFYGREGDVAAISSSYDATWKYGLQSPFTTQLAALWMGGMWHADNLQNSLITTGNGGTTPTYALLKINFASGSYYIRSKLLAPGEQLWVDVNDLKQRQLPDAKGNVIPLSASFGTYQIQDLNDPNVGALFEAKLTVDKTFGHAAYGCAVCCGDDYAWLDPDPFYTGVGSGGQEELWGSNECFGTETDRTSTSLGWMSTNTAVATMGPGKGWVNGINAGTSTISAYFNAQIDDGTGRCAFLPVQGAGPGSVMPVITGGNTVWWFNGQSPTGTYPISVTLSANGTGTATWSVTAGASRISLVPNGHSATVTSTGTHFSRAVGDISIKVTVGGVTSNAFTMTAKTPWKLVPRPGSPSRLLKNGQNQG